MGRVGLYGEDAAGRKEDGDGWTMRWEVLYKDPGSAKVLSYVRAQGAIGAPSTFGTSLATGLILGGVCRWPRPPWSSRAWSHEQTPTERLLPLRACVVPPPPAKMSPRVA